MASAVGLGLSLLRTTPPGPGDRSPRIVPIEGILSSYGHPPGHCRGQWSLSIGTERPGTIADFRLFRNEWGFVGAVS